MHYDIFEDLKVTRSLLGASFETNTMSENGRCDYCNRSPFDVFLAVGRPQDHSTSKGVSCLNHAKALTTGIAGGFRLQ